MKRIALIILLSLFALAGSTFAATSRPFLRLVDTDPLTVRGANFKAGEQVTVTAAMKQGAKFVRTSRASRVAASGAFTLTLAGVDVPNCGPWSVTATGASGTRATLKVVPQCGALPIAR